MGNRVRGCDGWGFGRWPLGVVHGYVASWHSGQVARTPESQLAVVDL